MFWKRITQVRWNAFRWMSWRFEADLLVRCLDQGDEINVVWVHVPFSSNTQDMIPRNQRSPLNRQIIIIYVSTKMNNGMI